MKLIRVLYIFVVGIYLIVSVATPGIVNAFTDCTDPTRDCLDTQDLSSINQDSPWVDLRDQPKENNCSANADTTDPTFTNTQTSKSIVTFNDTDVTHKIAQTFMLGIDASSTSTDDVTALVKQYPIGGIYFTGTTNAAAKGFNKNFFDSLNKLVKTPLIIASDEEGATSSDNSLTPIHRFDYGGTSFPVAKDLGSKDASTIESTAQGAGAVMASNGITVDLAPVLDIDNGRGAADQSVISKYGRAFSSDPSIITTDADAFSKGLQAAGVGSVFKHFPGIGSAWDDAHGNNTDAFKITGPSLAELKAKDLIPYQKLAGQDNAAIMLSNEYIPDWNGGTVPVSESPDAVLYLRKTLGFKGLIMTDSLSGPANYENDGSVASAVTKSEQAGANMVLFDYRNVDLGEVIKSVQHSSLLATGSDKLDASIQQIVDYKNQSGSKTQTPSLSGGCCSTTVTSVTGSAEGSKNKPIIWSILTTAPWNLSPAQAAGIMGNMQLESGFEPQRLQGTSPGTITAAKDWKNINGGGWGLVQWTPGSKIIKPTLDAGRDPNELGTQLDFLHGQLFGKDGSGELGTTSPENRAGSDLLAVKDGGNAPEKASDVFGFEYERFGTDSGTERSTFARAIYNEYKDKAPVPPNTDSTATPDATTTDQATLATALDTGCPTSFNGDFSGDASQLATQILEQWGKVFTGNPGAKQDLLSTKAGKSIRNSDSCGRTVQSLDPTLLQTMLKLGQKYKISIGSFITGHGCDQFAHPYGWAVDIMSYTDASGHSSRFCNRVMSSASCPNISTDKVFYQYLASVAPKGSILLQAGCGGRGTGVKPAPGVQTSDYDWCDHQHFNVKQDKLDQINS